ncbi:thioesterase II family protein [Anabaena catenula]|uniref:Thioesterase n=1 Tax=Anabaena catenula FACHB-362 TaxID=2692877 RepID=A0ABR8J4T0_9NOST|nr:thioesterase II family protein [Anabaena catenula]MBD2692146.1 thioesterase [Anabaena catenula FACHB-362]
MTTKTTFNSWVTCPQPNPQAKLRLFCLPYAGGSAMVFRTWANDLPSTIEVCPLELPGRGRQMNLPPYTKMQPLVEEIAQNLTPYLDKPFAIFGHSMGGLVSFELTRLLRSDYNLTPLHLFISARNAPQVTPSKRPIYNLPDAEFWQEIWNFNGTPDDVMENQDIIQLFLPILRADFTVLDTYIYTIQPPLDCPISVFGGLQDKEFTDYELEAWREQTTASFSLQMLEGNHFFIRSNQNILLRSIAQQLE